MQLPHAALGLGLQSEQELSLLQWALASPQHHQLYSGSRTAPPSVCTPALFAGEHVTELRLLMPGLQCPPCTHRTASHTPKHTCAHTDVGWCCTGPWQSVHVPAARVQCCKPHHTARPEDTPGGKPSGLEAGQPSLRVMLAGQAAERAGPPVGCYRPSGPWLWGRHRMCN